MPEHQIPVGNDRPHMIDSALALVNLLRQVGPTFDNGGTPHSQPDRIEIEEFAYGAALKFLIREFGRGWIDVPQFTTVPFEGDGPKSDGPQPSPEPVPVA